MWIGTNFGLNRYDGHSVDVMTRESSGLFSNTILGLHLDVNHKIWIIHREQRNFPITGIDVIDPTTYKITSLEDYLGNSLPFRLNEIIHLNADEKGNVYVILKSTIAYKYDATGLNPFVPSQAERNLIYSNSSRNGVLYNPANHKDLNNPTRITNYLINFPGEEIKGLDKDLTTTSFAYMGISSSGRTVMQSVDYKTHFITLFSLDSENRIDEKTIFSFAAGGYTKDVISYWDPHRKIVWVMAYPDFFTYDPTTGKITDVEYLAHEQIKSVRFSPNGKILFGAEDGVFIVTPQVKYFNTQLNNPDTQYSCRGFAEAPNGDIYVLTHGGNFIFHPKTNKLEEWDLIVAGIACISDHNGYIWIAEEKGQLQRFNPATNEIKNWWGRADNFFSYWSMLETRSHQIVIGGTSGLWLKDPDNLDSPVLYTQLNGFDQLRESTVFHILETDEGLWLSTTNGLFHVDLDKGVLAQYDDRSGLPNKNLLFLHVDAEGIFWIGTRGQGLIRWDRKENTFKNYTVNEGLSHNVIYAVFEDENGFLWMTSDYGLMRFEKETGICRTFLPADGITHEEFNRASYFKDRKGRFYFGGLRGFISFHPDDVLNAVGDRYPLLLTKFEVLDSKTGSIEDWTASVDSIEEIVLKPQIRSFVIHYSLLDYDDPKLKRYAYKIEGLDDNWHYVTENFIRINGLGGGSYKVHIKGQSGTGLWSEKELILPITVLRPFLVRPLTLTGIALLIVGLSYLYFRRRIALHQVRLERERQISNQLRNVDKLKDQFLANTSHELRTPLNGIVGLSESLLEKAVSKADREDLEMIISSGRRLSNLVNDILDFSRLKEHDLALQFKAVDIRTLADHCLRMNRHSIGTKPISLHNNIPTSLPCCYADENRLQQILQNLVANAIKFTNAGSITIDAILVDGMINVSITDTGIGIEKSKQELIFTEFEQADGSVAREFGGTGLGLSITKHLIELHHGKIHVVSELGKGTTFSFTIPAVLGEENDANAEAVLPTRYVNELVQEKNGNGNNSQINGDSKTHKSILIVDDEPVNLKVLKNHLEREGYEVTMAKDGQDALNQLESGKKFHLVLLDVMMPRMPGYEVCQKIREQHLLSALPVIMVTAKNQLSDLVEGLSVGANDYINKPFSKEELLARVKTQLQTFDIYEATGRFVPHQFIQSLGRHGITDLERGDMVEREVHVMFSDIRDYTSLAEDMTPKDNFRFVNSLAGKVGPIVKQNNGIVNQYLGDTIMMLFLQNADDGMRAAIEILRMVDTYNAQRRHKNRKLIKLGMGIHSGPLIMGIIGDTGRTEAAVISDTVNTASRMEGLTKHFGVNFIISESTVNKINEKDKFNLRYLGKVQVKGKHQPIGIYECFDGDKPEQVKLKMESIDSFRDGIEAYYAKDMINALKHFEAVYQANPADLTAFGFLHKVHGNIINGLSEDWNGVEMMHFK